MKKLNHLVLRKGLFASVKGYLFFIRAPSQSRGAGGGRTLLIFFCKKDIFNKAVDPRTLYLSKIGPACPYFLE